MTKAFDKTLDAIADLEEAVTEARTQKLTADPKKVQDLDKIISAVPVIVTLYQEQLSFIEKVPIVPILQFSSFVDELYGNLDQVNVIETA